MAIGSNTLRGVQRLAGAILVQAITDIHRGFGKRREDAIRWIADSSQRQFSFVSCCRMLNRDPHEVRRLLEKQDIFRLAVLGQSLLEAAASSRLDHRA